MMDKSRAFLRTLGLPGCDLHSSDIGGDISRRSAVRRGDPTVNTFAAAKALLRETQRLGVTVNRIDETLGGVPPHARGAPRICRALPRQRRCAHRVDRRGPRMRHTSATRLSRQGAVIGYRLRGEAARPRSRGREARVRSRHPGLLVYDEGLLWVLSEARKTGELPADTVLKASAHCGHGNGASFRLLEQCGADSINPVRDLSLDMLCALRASVSVPLDVHTDCPEGSGGFIRTYEAPRSCAAARRCISRSATALSPPTAHCRRRRTPRAWRSRPPS